MRLGDLDRIAQDVRDNNIENYYKQDWTSSQIVTLLENAPTIDAVPVVRCRECKYWRRYTRQWENHCAGECERHRMEGGTYENDFCSYGQRKEAENEVSEP